MSLKSITLATLAGAALNFAVGSAIADVGDTLREQCHAQLKLHASACDCIAERGTTELSPPQQELLVAMVMKDQQASAAARSKLAQTEVNQTLAFMGNAPTACMTQ